MKAVHISGAPKQPENRLLLFSLLILGQYLNTGKTNKKPLIHKGTLYMYTLFMHTAVQISLVGSEDSVTKSYTSSH